MSKRIKLEKKFEFRKKGNQIQHEFNESVAASMEEAAASLKEEDLAKMKEALQEGLKLLSERLKLLNITVIISPATPLLSVPFQTGLSSTGLLIAIRITSWLSLRKTPEWHDFLRNLP